MYKLGWTVYPNCEAVCKSNAYLTVPTHLLGSVAIEYIPYNSIFYHQEQKFGCFCFINNNKLYKIKIYPIKYK